MRALLHAFAALNHEGLQPRLRQMQRGEQTGGPHAHHDRAIAHRFCLCDRRRGRGIGQSLRVFRKMRNRALQAHIQRERKMHIALIARVHALFAHAHIGNFLRTHAQRARRQLYIFPIRVQRTGDLRNSYHKPHLFSISSAASFAEAHAHCRLKPPQSPSTSSTSPAANRLGQRMDSSASAENSVMRAPPDVTCA